MKKRCTNSACRRVYRRSLGACPHCGRGSRRRRITMVALTGVPRGGLIFAVKALRRCFGMDLRTAKRTAQALAAHPILLGPVEAARLPEELSRWEAHGFLVQAVPLFTLPRPKDAEPGWEIRAEGDGSRLLAENLSLENARDMVARRPAPEGTVPVIRWKWDKSEPPI